MPWGKVSARQVVQADEVIHLLAHAERAGLIRDVTPEQPHLASAGPQLAGHHNITDKKQHTET